jgi:hypothetical protein
MSIRSQDEAHSFKWNIRVEKRESGHNFEIWRTDIFPCKLVTTTAMCGKEKEHSNWDWREKQTCWTMEWVESTCWRKKKWETKIYILTVLVLLADMKDHERRKLKCGLPAWPSLGLVKVLRTDADAAVAWLGVSTEKERENRFSLDTFVLEPTSHVRTS